MPQIFEHNGIPFIELSISDDDADWIKRLPGSKTEATAHAIALRLHREEQQAEAESDDG